jgi:hypothetical protein
LLKAQRALRYDIRIEREVSQDTDTRFSLNPVLGCARCGSYTAQTTATPVKKEILSQDTFSTDRRCTAEGEKLQ